MREGTPPGRTTWRGACGTSVAVALICLAFPAETAGVTESAENVDKSGFLSAVEAALSTRDRALGAAQDDFSRIATTLEAAAARVGADAAGRLRDGALARARGSLMNAVEAAEVEWVRRVDEAVRIYEPAGIVWNAVKESTAALRTELEVFRAVLESTDFVAKDSAALANAVSRVAAGEARDVAALDAKAATAKAKYDAADRAYREAVARRPEKIEASRFGGERFAAFVDGLGARLRGDAAAAAAADRAGEEAFEARLDAIAEAEAANDVAERQYEATVAAARARRDAAASTYRDAAAAVSRASRGVAAATAERESASRDHEAALAARRVAFVDIAKTVRVYGALELREVEAALTAGALSAIGELETAALKRVTADSARQAIEAGLDAYGRARRTALLSHEKALKVKYSDAMAEALNAEGALEAAQAKNDARVADVSPILDRIQRGTYARDVAAADRALEDALVEALGLAPVTYDSGTFASDRARDLVRQAGKKHGRAILAARASRSRALAEAFPELEVEALGSRFPPVLVDPDDLPGWLDGGADRVLRELGGYKRYRSFSEFEAAVLTSLKTDNTRLAAHARDSQVAAEVARVALDTAVGADESLVAFDQQAVGRLGVLEADVRAGILAASQGSRLNRESAVDPGRETSYEADLSRPTASRRESAGALSGNARQAIENARRFTRDLAEADMPKRPAEPLAGLDGHKAASVAARPDSVTSSEHRAQCLIPGFPRPADAENLALPWCPASVDFQIRSTALVAAGAQCAIALGTSSTPEQIEARQRETADLCARLDALVGRFGGTECRCPEDWR